MVKRKSRTKSRKTSRTTTKVSHPTKDRIPLVEHLKELKRRIIYVAVAVIALSAVVYGFERQLIDVLLRPSHGQHFVYTSPMGGINFVFNVCIYFGVALSVPVIIYNLLKFLQPLMRNTTQRFIVIASSVSGVLAVCGILFGYFAGLPAALHFLLKQQFQNGQVEALINIQSYFSFVVAYMFGAALMFQLPLLLVIINRIKPLNPKKMLKYERMVILFSFIIAFIMNPTPNLIDQLLTVVPVLISYQVGIVIVWFINRRMAHRRYKKLFDQDAAAQEERLEKVRKAIPLKGSQLEAPVMPKLATRQPQPVSKNPAQPTPQRPQRTVSPQYIGSRPDYASRGQLLQL